jgi:hypothetical protein
MSKPAKTPKSCVNYAGESGEGGYIMCGRGLNELKVFTSICVNSCPYRKEKTK